jgi:hypothetical protein
MDSSTSSSLCPTLQGCPQCVVTDGKATTCLSLEATGQVLKPLVKAGRFSITHLAGLIAPCTKHKQLELGWLWVTVTKNLLDKVGTGGGGASAQQGPPTALLCHCIRPSAEPLLQSAKQSDIAVPLQLSLPHTYSWQPLLTHLHSTGHRDHC